MLKEERMAPDKPVVGDASEFIRLSCADFQRNPDGSWGTTKQINIDGPGGVQRLMAAGRQFKRGQMFIFGLDLAVVLESQCTR